MNLDFFEALYRQYRPDFATFHTNHIAHYMHRYWRAMDPTPFRVKPSAEEVRRFGPSIEYGYRVGGPGAASGSGSSPTRTPS